MYLLLTLESQVDALSVLLRKTISNLSFVTDKNKGLQNVDNYGKEFRFISVIPSCMNDEFWNAFGWSERKQIWRKKREADIRLRMNYDRFVKETPENQRLMYVDIIVKSIQVVQSRSKGDFKGEKLIQDILTALNVTDKELKHLNA